MITKRKNNNAFTLIELLVAITIIAIIVTISIFGLQGARESARDARRKSDLGELKAALELFRSDVGRYPRSSEFPSAGGSLSNAGNVYLSSVPADPQGSGRRYSYNPTGNPPTSYTLCASLEGTTASVSGCGSCGQTCSYKVTSP